MNGAIRAEWPRPYWVKTWMSKASDVPTKASNVPTKASQRTWSWCVLLGGSDIGCVHSVRRSFLWSFGRGFIRQRCCRRAVLDAGIRGQTLKATFTELFLGRCFWTLQSTAVALARPAAYPNYGNMLWKLRTSAHKCACTVLRNAHTHIIYRHIILI